MITFFRVERNAAALLLVAAILGLALCNLGFAPQIAALKTTELTLGGLLDHFTLMAWLGEFFIAGFFLLIGLELKREMAHGELKQPRNVLVPGLAALFGAAVPAAIYLVVVPAGSPAAAGWAIPMATDVTFALAVFALFGKNMPRAARVFLLAFAVIDDLIAILVIAIFLGGKLQLGWLAAAAVSLIGFWLLQRAKASRFILHTQGDNAKPRLTWFAIALSVALGIAAWYFVYRAGVQPAVVGVILGLMISTSRVDHVEHVIHPWVAIGVLPVFAFFAAAIEVAGSFDWSAPITVAILLRPLGKVVGICLGVWLAAQLLKGSATLAPSDYLRVSILGGMGFTVSLLIANSVFGAGSALANQAILATLVAFAASAVLGSLVFALRRST